MTKNRKIPNHDTSFLGKTKRFFTNLLGINTKSSAHIKTTDDDDNGSQSGDTGRQKIQGQGFLDPKAATLKDTKGFTANQYVKDPETVIYDQLRKDPGAMLALKRLTNGQIPASEASAVFDKVKNSEVALETIANSPYAPSDIKAKAQAELAHQQRKKLAAQPGFKKKPPKPKP